MAMTFTATLTCTACKATLRYEDERPAWKTYDYRVEQADECERSARFVAEHADPFPPHVALEQERSEGGPPVFVIVNRVPFTDELQARLKIPDPRCYLDCPVCDAKIWGPA